MVLPKSKNSVGLGNSLMNDRFGKGKGTDMRRGNAIQRTGATGEKYITNEKQEASWVKMRSVTEQAALEEFLSTAELAGTDFTAEKMNSVKIVHVDQENPYLLPVDEQNAVAKKHKAHRSRLTVPRRPKWDQHTTSQELDARERASVLEWRRGLAQLQQSNDLILTPFERNIEVWRQLWRVIERSDLVVQIIDARNPLMFRCEDLEKYVKEVDEKKNNLLLINKADMMNLEQRTAWADYFDLERINFKFFSAEIAKQENEARAAFADQDTDHMSDLSEADEDEDDEDDTDDTDDTDDKDDKDGTQPRPGFVAVDDSPLRAPASTKVDDRIKILTTHDLEELFLANSPAAKQVDGKPARKAQIGLVGYPNVGKSSTINALIGAKKVSVSATPGKTKHFQTIHLSDQVILCDCPGLVFPNFASTKAELVCNGVLPIDQLREFTGPAGLVAQRIPKPFLEALYGMKIHVRPLDEGGNGVTTASEMLRAYATARGFFTQGQGQPDQSRAARYILKDYIKGKLLYCSPPPMNPPLDPIIFNMKLPYNDAYLPQHSSDQLTKATVQTSAEDASLKSSMSTLSLQNAPLQGAKSANIDQNFFAKQGSIGHLRMPFQYQYSEQGSEQAKKQLTGRKHRTMLALENNVDPSEVMTNSKKHFKANKRKAKAKVSANPTIEYD